VNGDFAFTAHVLSTLGHALVVTGLLAVLVRRSLVVVTGGLVVALMGVAVLFVAASAVHGEPTNLARAALVMAGIVIVAGVCGAAAIASYRQRGTVNLDEERELRG